MLKKVRQLARRACARVGSAAADCAIAWHRRPDAEAAGPSVHMLVSSRTWHAGLLAAVSFEHHTGRKWKFYIHEDGSVDERARESIKKVLPDVRLISREESDAKASDIFRAYPKCFAQRKRHNLFLKFSDFAAFTPGDRFIVLDSDVIFFRRPSELLEWTDKGADTCLYNKDTREKYCLPREPIEQSMALGMWPCFNSGLILMPRAAVDCPLAERFVAQFEETAHHPQFFEQTLYGLMASAWGRGGALPSSYEISWGYFRQRDAVCRHYVGEFKHDLLYIEAGPNLLMRSVAAAATRFLRSIPARVWLILLPVVFCALVFAAVFVSRPSTAASEGIFSFFDPKPFQAVQVRSGLPATRGKLESGSPVVIGFLGGSITQNAEPGGFVSALRDHLGKQFPGARLTTVNAGMAGTDSAWGAKRVGRDLLVERPDVVFVEFAVNDGERDDSAADMELIVRRIHDVNPEAEVVFLYVTSDTAFRKLTKAKVPKAILEHEKVADHYGIPSVTFGSDLFAKSRSDDFAWENFFHDACHPKPAGYESYSRDLVAAIHRLLHAREENARRFPEPMKRTPAFSDSERTVNAEQTPQAAKGKGNAAAKGAERMPAFGTEWTETPFSHSASGSEWRLEYTVLDSVPGESAAASLEAEWLPARWFGEAGGFTGRRSRLIAENDASTGSKLSIMPFVGPGSIEVPQVVWSPAKAGRYLVEVSASKIRGHVNSPPAMAGIEIFSRSANGAAQKLSSVSSGDGQSLEFSKELLLREGEDLVVRPFAKGYEYVQLEGFNVVTSALNVSPTP